LEFTTCQLSISKDMSDWINLLSAASWDYSTGWVGIAACGVPMKEQMRRISDQLADYKNVLPYFDNLIRVIESAEVRGFVLGTWLGQVVELCVLAEVVASGATLPAYKSAYFGVDITPTLAINKLEIKLFMLERFASQYDSERLRDDSPDRWAVVESQFNDGKSCDLLVKVV
jgi:hypothetical protein